MSARDFLISYLLFNKLQFCFKILNFVYSDNIFKIIKSPYSNKFVRTPKTKVEVSTKTIEFQIKILCRIHLNDNDIKSFNAMNYR